MCRQKELLTLGYNIAPKKRTNEKPVRGIILNYHLGLPLEPVAPTEPRSQFQKDLTKVFSDLGSVLAVMSKVLLGVLLLVGSAFALCSILDGRRSFRDYGYRH